MNRSSKSLQGGENNLKSLQQSHLSLVPQVIVTIKGVSSRLRTIPFFARKPNKVIYYVVNCPMGNAHLDDLCIYH